MTIEGRYFDWLQSLVGPTSDRNPSRSYTLLLEAMFNYDFTWRVANDDNRAEDGTALRDDFCDIVGSWEGSRFIFEPCTVLEMLIALAKRLAFETDEDDMDEGLLVWFWRMVDNLGLSTLTDDDYDDHLVRRVLNVFVLRRYDRSGNGGIFPLSHPTEDQRETEIWLQMSAYLIEGFNQNYA